MDLSSHSRQPRNWQQCVGETKKGGHADGFLVFGSPGRKRRQEVLPALLETLEWREGNTGLPPFLIYSNLHQSIQSVQSLSRVWLSATPWTAARQASLSITNSQSSLRLMSIESVMPSSHLILCRPLLFLPSIPPNIKVFSNESTLLMRWPKYWSFSFSIIPSK